jgi:hypothetical protein
MGKKLTFQGFIKFETDGKSPGNQLIFFFLLTLLFAAQFATAQNEAGITTRVKGVITEKESGQGLEGVNVKVKGLRTGTSTDNKGSFALDVPANRRLVFSYVGFLDQEVAVKNQATINVVMEKGISSLNEV